jgi:hypothetical protein
MEDGRHSKPSPTTCRWSRSRDCRMTATPGCHFGRRDHLGWSRHPRGHPCGNDDPIGTAGGGQAGALVDGGRGACPPSPRRHLTAGRSAVECRGRSRGLNLHGELLEEKLIPHSVEGGKGHDPLDESLQVVVTGAEAMQKVQHQGTVDDGLTEVAERVFHALHLAAVLSHGENPLREQGELASRWSA